MDDSKNAPQGLVLAGPRLYVGVAGSFYVQVFHDTPVVEDLDAIFEVVERLEHPYGLITVIPSVRSVRLGKETRARVDRLAEQTRGWVHVHTGVVLDRGFAAAFARGVMAAANFILSDHEQAVTSSLDEAFAHIAQHLGGVARNPGPDAVHAIVNQTLDAAGCAPELRLR